VGQGYPRGQYQAGVIGLRSTFHIAVPRTDPNVRVGSIASWSAEAAPPSVSALAPIADVSLQRNETTRWANSGREQLQQILAPIPGGGWSGSGADGSRRARLKHLREESSAPPWRICFCIIARTLYPSEDETKGSGHSQKLEYRGRARCRSILYSTESSPMPERSKCDDAN
jgi:hypothetical protein